MNEQRLNEQRLFPFSLEESWQEVLKEELTKPYLSQLVDFVEKEYSVGDSVYPPKNLIFEAFRLTPFNQVRVVIVGQDPYHGPGQAQGLCFSVPKGVRFPPSLQNIFKELQTDLGINYPSHGCLASWAQQGVLLLNATLTVRQSKPLSHHKKGWELFTDAVIRKIYERHDFVIFVLWGKSAQDKFQHLKKVNQEKRHVVLMAPHPSPLSAYQGFLGCRHFSKINELLKIQKQSPIEWVLD